MDNNSGPRPRDNGPRRGQGIGGVTRGIGGNIAGNPGRPNNFNRGPPQNRGPNNNTYNNRR